jgi:hypothetical protein
VSENRTTDAPRDPAFAAVARVLDAEKAFTAAVAVKDYSRDVGLDEARAALAATVATTPAGLAVITGFIREARPRWSSAASRGPEVQEVPVDWALLVSSS